MTSRKFLIENFHGSADDLKALFIANGISEIGIKEDDDNWQIESQRELKVYDAEAFISDAKKYHSEVPPNLIQTAAKLWLAAVYVLKRFYLDLNVHITSHSSMKFFAKLAGNLGSDPANLYGAWLTAEKLHSYSYGCKRFSVKEFPTLIAQTEWFVKEFASIPKDRVAEKLNGMNFGAIPEVNYIYEKDAKTELSGIKFKAENKFY